MENINWPLITGALLTFISSIVGWVFINTLRSFKDEIKNIHTRVDTREEEHDQLKEKHEGLHREVIQIKAETKIAGHQLADLVVMKLKTEGY